MFALVAAPALAAKPQKPPAVTWRGTGIDDAGSRVHFSGSAVQVGEQDWRGTATFIDREKDLVADIFLDSIDEIDPVAGRAAFSGVARVTEGDTIHGGVDAFIQLDKATSTYSMGFTTVDASWDYYTTIGGDDFRGIIRFR